MSLPKVGWTREDEDGWFIIDRIEYEEAQPGATVIDLMAALKASLSGGPAGALSIVGYWAEDKHGGEHWFAADKIGDNWKDPYAAEDVL